MLKNELEKVLNKTELKIVRKLSTPHKVQDFLDTMPFNFEEKGETYMSPRSILKANKVHCFEGAVFALLCLTYHGYKNYLLDLKVQKSAKKDSDHTLCIFEMGKHWGAISKTNHSVLRWRDPIYRSPRELAMTYFHEYFLDTGEKTLESYSTPFDIFRKFGTDWITASDDLDQVAESLDHSLHHAFIPKVNNKLVRKAGNVEVAGAAIQEWQKNKKRV